MRNIVSKHKGMSITVVESSELTAGVAGEAFMNIVRAKPGSVVGIATGNSTLPMIRYLVEKNAGKKNELTDITATNLDEWVAYEDEKSCKHRIERDFFSPLQLKNVRYIDPPPFKENSGANFEKWLASIGGYDLVVLGIGPNGHIGFNEPGSAPNSITRVVDIAPETRSRYIEKYKGLENVPKQGLTVGVKTIKDSRALIVIAFGKNKAEPIRQLVEGDPSNTWVCSLLQNHPQIELVLDEEAASLLKKN